MVHNSQRCLKMLDHDTLWQLAGSPRVGSSPSMHRGFSRQRSLFDSGNNAIHWIRWPLMANTSDEYALLLLSKHKRWKISLYQVSANAVWWQFETMKPNTIDEYNASWIFMVYSRCEYASWLIKIGFQVFFVVCRSFLLPIHDYQPPFPPTISLQVLVGRSSTGGLPTLFAIMVSWYDCYWNSILTLAGDGQSEVR